MPSRRDKTALLSLAVCMAIAPFAHAQDEVGADYFDAGEDTTFATMLQPRLQTPAESVAPELPARSSRYSQRSAYVRLARAPNMFGDWFNSLGQVQVTTAQTGTLMYESDLPQAGGRLPRVTENNKPIPMDRVYYTYNGFQNAVSFGTRPGPGLPIARRELILNRHTVGLEKTFFEESASLEVRMPFFDGLDFDLGECAVDTGHVGNLSLFLKQLVYDDEMFAAAVGLGLTTPTGSDIKIEAGSSDFFVRNEAYHLLPYFGFLATPTQDWFIIGFVQLDLAANGNEVGFATGERGVHTEQNLFAADLSIGRWLYQEENVDYLRGVAAVFELHYTSTIQDADQLLLRSGSATANPASALLINPANRFDTLNATLGLHFQITELTDLRVACAAPLRPGSNRQFDSEIQVQVNRRF